MEQNNIFDNIFQKIETLKSIQFSDELKLIEEMLLLKNIDNLDITIIKNAIDEKIINKNNEIMKSRELFKIHLLKDIEDQNLKTNVLRVYDYMFDNDELTIDLRKVFYEKMDEYNKKRLKFDQIKKPSYDDDDNKKEEYEQITNEISYEHINILMNMIKIAQVFYNAGLKTFYYEHFGRVNGGRLYSEIPFTNDSINSLKTIVKFREKDCIYIHKEFL